MKSIDWNATHASGKRYTAMPDTALDDALRAAGSPKTILEIACGTGELAVRLAQRGLTVTATDGSSVALATARKAAESAGVTIKFIESNFHTPDFVSTLDGPYDAIVMRLALAFVEEKNTFLKRIKSLLTPEGTFICSTPILLPGKEYDERQRNISLSKEELEELLRGHFAHIELIIPDEIPRPDWPLATYLCRI